MVGPSILSLAASLSVAHHPQSCSSWLSILGGARKKWASSVVCHTSREIRHSLTHSKFSSEEKLLAEKGSLGTEPFWSFLGWGVMWIKSKYSFYPLQSILFQIFSPPSGVQELFHWTPGLPRGFLICGWLSEFMLSRGSWTPAVRSWSCFMGRFSIHIQDQCVCVFYLMHGWVRVLLDPLKDGTSLNQR